MGEEAKLRYEDIFSEENYDACFNDNYYSIDEDKIGIMKYYLHYQIIKKKITLNTKEIIIKNIN